MNTKNIVIASVVFALVFLGGSYLGKPVVNVNPNGEVVGVAAGTDHYSPERFWAGFGGGTLATSTSGTAATLREKDLYDNTYISMTPNVASFAYTFPATSTLSTLLKNAGDTQTWTFVNATTTAGTTLTLTKGAGWNFTGVDANVDVIAGAAWGSQVNVTMDCTRQIDKDILCRLTENIATD